MNIEKLNFVFLFIFNNIVLAWVKEKIYMDIVCYFKKLHCICLNLSMKFVFNDDVQ